MQEWHITGVELEAGPFHPHTLPATKQGISGRRQNDSLEVGLGTMPQTFPLLKYISAAFSLCNEHTRTAHTDVKLLFRQICFE